MKLETFFRVGLAHPNGVCATTSQPPPVYRSVPPLEDRQLLQSVNL